MMVFHGYVSLPEGIRDCQMYIPYCSFCSIDFPCIFVGFPMMVPFSHGFPMVFPWLRHRFGRTVTRSPVTAGQRPRRLPGDRLRGMEDRAAQVGTIGGGLERHRWKWS